MGYDMRMVEIPTEPYYDPEGLGPVDRRRTQYGYFAANISAMSWLRDAMNFCDVFDEDAPPSKPFCSNSGDHITPEWARAIADKMEPHIKVLANVLWLRAFADPASRRELEWTVSLLTRWVAFNRQAADYGGYLIT